MFSKGEIVELTITGYAFGGRGIAKIPIDDSHFVVFVDNSFPGQLVRAKIDVKRKNHAEAKLIDVITRSKEEVVSEYQEISGGPYIYVPPALQEEVKESYDKKDVESVKTLVDELNSKFQQISQELYTQSDSMDVDPNDVEFEEVK